MYILTLSPYYTTCDDGPVHLPCSARGRAELRAWAAVVAIGVGSPVARLGADGRWTRDHFARVGSQITGRSDSHRLAPQSVSEIWWLVYSVSRLAFYKEAQFFPTPGFV